MKTKILVIITMLVFSVAGFAENSTLDVKGGIQYPKAPEKVGFDSAVTLNVGVDKYFTIGAETGFGMITWEKKVGESLLGTSTPLEKKTETNLYSLPLLAVAKIRAADMIGEYGFMPYVTGGAGYSWTWYTTPDDTTTFSGFTWEALAGVEVRLGSDSNLALVLEGGYRGAKVKDADDYELNMSGYIGRIGISFPLEVSE